MVISRTPQVEPGLYDGIKGC